VLVRERAVMVLEQVLSVRDVVWRACEGQPMGGWCRMAECMVVVVGIDGWC